MESFFFLSKQNWNFNRCKEKWYGNQKHLDFHILWNTLKQMKKNMVLAFKFLKVEILLFFFYNVLWLYQPWIYLNFWNKQIIFPTFLPQNDINWLLMYLCIYFFILFFFCFKLCLLLPDAWNFDASIKTLLWQCYQWFNHLQFSSVCNG